MKLSCHLEDSDSLIIIVLLNFISKSIASMQGVLLVIASVFIVGFSAPVGEKDFKAVIEENILPSNLIREQKLDLMDLLRVGFKWLKPDESDTDDIKQKKNIGNMIFDLISKELVKTPSSKVAGVKGNKFFELLSRQYENERKMEADEQDFSMLLPILKMILPKLIELIASNYSG